MAPDLIERFLSAGLSFQHLQDRLNSCPEPSKLQFALQFGPRIPVHLSPGIGSQSFEKSYSAANKFLKNIENVHLSSNKGGWIDIKTGEKIRSYRPAVSRPIYFISAEDDYFKTIVYVGQTSNLSSRFYGGHAAISKLHAPNYCNKEKYVYMCAVLVRIDQDDWVNIEYLRAARELLTQLESQLILQLDPVFNSEQTKDQRAGVFTIVHDNKYRLDKMYGIFFSPRGLEELPPSPTV
ncbi:MAG: hypothetical protein U1E02_30225 [Hydrogenophaga sp.]|nr:hypothetical protein [Hydrogenophaga sp.]